MPGSADALRHVMGRFASGVTVVTALRDGIKHAMTATAVSSVSLEPPLILVCVSKTSRFHTAIMRGRRLGVSLLGRGPGAPGPPLLQPRPGSADPVRPRRPRSPRTAQRCAADRRRARLDGVHDLRALRRRRPHHRGRRAARASGPRPVDEAAEPKASVDVLSGDLFARIVPPPREASRDHPDRPRPDVAARRHPDPGPSRRPGPTPTPDAERRPPRRAAPRSGAGGRRRPSVRDRARRCASTWSAT